MVSHVSHALPLAYFSTTSENTHRFVLKLGLDAHRIPLSEHDPPLLMGEPFVLITPTYGGGKVAGAVPKQVIRFLNEEQNRAALLGVISAGNTNFGSAYGLAGDIVATKCHAPHLYRFELMGTPDDVRVVREGISTLWRQLCSPTPASKTSVRSTTTP